jgi:hypothetical protein
MRVTVPSSAWGPADAAGFRYAAALIETAHPDFPHWQQPVRVTLRDRFGALDIVGIERSPSARPGPVRIAAAASSTAADADRSWFSKTFKDARPGACGAGIPVSPSTSWPARHEAAVTFCQQ